MERNTLELARNSLFIEKIKNASQAAKAVRLVKVFMDTHTLLESPSGPFRKKVLQKTPSQGKFP
jgi:hypothetical protein